jgi:hypothetical protein
MKCDCDLIFPIPDTVGTRRSQKAKKDCLAKVKNDKAKVILQIFIGRKETRDGFLDWLPTSTLVSRLLGF